MIRATLFLPEALHQRLVIQSRRSGKSFSELARELFRKALAEDREQEILKTYDALDELDSIGGAGITDASTTIDKVLYGERGAWRGETGEHGLWELPQNKPKSKS